MDTDSTETRMIFRKFPEGDVIALMPDQHERQYISSYQHIGQHGAASPELIKDLEPANLEEIAILKTELERIGYKVKVEM